MKFLNFFSTFVGHFCPPGSESGSGFRIRIRIYWPDWIRVQLGSGSATLVTAILMQFVIKRCHCSVLRRHPCVEIRKLILHVPLLISVVVITVTSLAFYAIVCCFGNLSPFFYLFLICRFNLRQVRLIDFYTMAGYFQKCKYNWQCHLITFVPNDQSSVNLLLNYINCFI